LEILGKSRPQVIQQKIPIYLLAGGPQKVLLTRNCWSQNVPRANVLAAQRGKALTDELLHELKKQAILNTDGR
jgi:hypothetical protein